MIRLRAIVRKATGKAVHRVADGIGVWTLTSPTSVEVVAGDSGFYLFRLDDDGTCIADTWHETVEAAKAQANYEYEIREEDWRDMRH